MMRLTAWVLALFMIVLGATQAQAAKGKKPKRSPEQRFAKADADHDGKLSLDELIGKRTGEEKLQAEKRFHKRDLNKDGFISADEFKATIKKKSS